MSTDESNGPLEEWKVARQATDKFDEKLSDTRKYSFSFITGLITAQGIFGFSEANVTLGLQIGAIIATMPLVTVSYWLDRYYFALLMGAVARCEFLEKKKLNGFSLTSYISNYGLASFITRKKSIPFLYSIFLLSLLILGLFAFGLFSGNSLSQLDDNNRFLLEVLIIAFFANVIGIAIIYFTHNVESGRKLEMIKNKLDDLNTARKEESN